MEAGGGLIYTVTEDGLPLGGEHTVQYPGLVSSKCTLETYVILLTNDP